MKMDLLKKKKMLLAYALATSLSVSALTGCGNSGFSYLKENETIVANGVVNYDLVKSLKLIHLTNEIAQLDEYVLVSEILVFTKYKGSITYYEDVETGKQVYSTKGDDFKNFEVEIIVDHMVDYLYKYDIVKDEYSIVDVEKLKEYLLNDETLNIGKSEEQEENDKEEARVLRKSKKYC